MILVTGTSCLAFVEDVCSFFYLSVRLLVAGLVFAFFVTIKLHEIVMNVVNLLCSYTSLGDDLMAF